MHALKFNNINITYDYNDVCLPKFQVSVEDSEILRFYSDEIHLIIFRNFSFIILSLTIYNTLFWQYTLIAESTFKSSYWQTKKICKYDSKLSGFIVMARCLARLSRLYYVLNACHDPASTRFCLILKSLDHFFLLPVSASFSLRRFTVRSTFQALAEVIHVL